MNQRWIFDVTGRYIGPRKKLQRIWDIAMKKPGIILEWVWDEISYETSSGQQIYEDEI